MRWIALTVTATTWHVFSCCAQGQPVVGAGNGSAVADRRQLDLRLRHVRKAFLLCSCARGMEERHQVAIVGSCEQQLGVIKTECALAHAECSTNLLLQTEPASPVPLSILHSAGCEHGVRLLLQALQAPTAAPAAADATLQLHTHLLLQHAATLLLLATSHTVVLLLGAAPGLPLSWLPRLGLLQEVYSTLAAATEASAAGPGDDTSGTLRRRLQGPPAALHVVLLQEETSSGPGIHHEQLAAEVQQVLQPARATRPGSHSSTSKPPRISNWVSSGGSSCPAGAPLQLLQLAGVHCCAAPGGLGDAAHQAAAAFCTQQLEGPGSASWRSWLAADHQQLPGLAEVVHKCLRQATCSSSPTTTSGGSGSEMRPGGEAQTPEQLQEVWQQLVQVLLPCGVCSLPPSATASGLAAAAVTAATKALHLPAAAEEPLSPAAPLAPPPSAEAAAAAAAAGASSDAASDSGSISSWKDAELQEEAEDEGPYVTRTTPISAGGALAGRTSPANAAVAVGGRRSGGGAAAGQLLAAGLDPAYCASLAACQQCAAAAARQYIQALPPRYTRARHSAAAAAALAAYKGTAQGPAAGLVLEQLTAALDLLWCQGRQQCEAVSLSGWPCALPPHGNPPPAGAGGEGGAAEGGDEAVHSSGQAWVVATSDGVQQLQMEDWFTLTEANMALMAPGSHVQKAGAAHQVQPLDVVCQLLQQPGTTRSSSSSSTGTQQLGVKQQAAVEVEVELGQWMALAQLDKVALGLAAPHAAKPQQRRQQQQVVDKKQPDAAKAGPLHHNSSSSSNSSQQGPVMLQQPGVLPGQGVLQHLKLHSPPAAAGEERGAGTTVPRSEASTMPPPGKAPPAKPTAAAALAAAAAGVRGKLPAVFAPEEFPALGAAAKPQQQAALEPAAPLPAPKVGARSAGQQQALLQAAWAQLGVPKGSPAAPVTASAANFEAASVGCVGWRGSSGGRGGGGRGAGGRGGRGPAGAAAGGGAAAQAAAATGPVAAEVLPLAELWIGLEYEDWQGHRFVATPQQLGLAQGGAGTAATAAAAAQPFRKGSAAGGGSSSSDGGAFPAPDSFAAASRAAAVAAAGLSPAGKQTRPAQPTAAGAAGAPARVPLAELLLQRDLPLFLLSTAEGVSSTAASGSPAPHLSTGNSSKESKGSAKATPTVTATPAAVGGGVEGAAAHRGTGGASNSGAGSGSPRPSHLFQLQRIHVVTPPAPFQLVTCPQVVFTRTQPQPLPAADAVAAGVVGRGSSSSSGGGSGGTSKGWGLQSAVPQQKQKQVHSTGASAGPAAAAAQCGTASGGGCAGAASVTAMFSLQAPVALPPDSWCVLMLPRMYGMPAEWRQLATTTSSSSTTTTKQPMESAQKQQAEALKPSMGECIPPGRGLVPIPYWLPGRQWSAMVVAGTWLRPAPAPAGL